MSKTILCAVDINRPQDEAQVVKEAKKLADFDGAQLDVITVVPDFGANVVSAYFKDHDVKPAKDGAAKLLNKMIADVIGDDANKNVRHIVAIGSVYEEVLKAAKLSKADLIVISTHARSGLQRWVYGSTTEMILREAPCPVLVIRK